VSHAKVTSSTQGSTSCAEPQNAATLLHSSSFGQLFNADKKRLYAYIFAYLQDKPATDDVFQECCLTLWKEFEKFEPGTNFSKWANSIAFNRIQVFRRTQQKYQLGLSDDFMQQFAQNLTTIESKALSQEQKWCYLEQCCQLLAPPLQNIYQSFYVNNQTAAEIAEINGRSIRAIRKAVHKLRKSLFDCIDQKITEGAS
jgi:RNA polymerase sigma-70 factor, ECF subfamily